MKIFLRNVRTRQFLTEADDYTEEPLKAYDFASTENAIRKALSLREEHFEILMYFGEPRYDFVLELPDYSTPASEVLDTPATDRSALVSDDKKNFRKTPMEILVVENEETDRYVLGRAVEAAGTDAKVVFMQDGVEAIDYINDPARQASRAGAPLLLFLDLVMPGVDGFTVLEALSRKPPRSKVNSVVVSVLNERQYRDRAYALGVSSYLVKPIEQEAVTNIVSDFAKMVES